MAALPTREDRAELGKARLGSGCRPPAIATGGRLPTGPTRSPCSRSRRRRGSPSSSRSATAGWPSRPFTFFRGAALPMAVDLAPTPVSGLTVQACGDAHLSNFGLFASPERDLLFDINDFDETLPGPWSGTSSDWPPAWCGRAGARLRRRHDAHTVHAAVHSYRQRMIEFAEMAAIDVFYSRVDVAAITTFVNKRALPFLAVDGQVIVASTTASTSCPS